MGRRRRNPKSDDSSASEIEDVEMDDRRSRSSRSSRSPSPRTGRDELVENLMAENSALKQQNREMLDEIRAMREAAKLSDERQKRLEVQILEMSQMLRQALQKEETPKKRPSSPADERSEMAESQATGVQQQAKVPKKDNQVSHETQETQVSKEPTPSTSQSCPENNKQSPQKAPRVPPIILRQKEKWTGISGQLVSKRIAYTKARLTGEGIQVQPATVEDYRKMTRYLASQQLEYHTYSLPEEKPLRVVIRGIPDGVTNDEIKEDLENQGHKIESVSRMTSRRTKRSMPLVLIKAPQDQQGLLKVNRCCALVVKVEAQKEQKVSGQCFRCQRFGHAQGHCTAQPKCVKCGGGHRAAECKKPRDTPARCANCQGDHPASYRGCPSFPKLRKQAQPTQAQGARPTQAPRQAPRTQARAQQGSYANAAKRGPTTNNEAALTAASLTAALEQMQRMYSAMSAFFAKMPSMPTA